MTDNTNEISMNVSRAMQLAQQMVISPGILLAVQIYQFIARQRDAKQLKTTDWENFDKFCKFCNYEYEAASIPLTEENLGTTEIPMYDKRGKPVLDENGKPKMETVSLKDLKKDEIKEWLDSMGIHYCMMDNDFSDNNIKVYYTKKDKQLFEQFFSDYVKDNLVTGEMKAGDLKNLLDDRVSIISVSDELEKELKDAMAKTDISYASIQDLNLTDGQKQMYIPNMSTSAVTQLYTALRNNLLQKGMDDPGPIAEISTGQLLGTATARNVDDFLVHCSGESKEISQSYVNDQSKKLEDVMQRFEPLGSQSAVKYIQDENYEEISIDAQTLNVADADAFVSQGNKPGDFFACRVPGTYGQNIRYLCIPRDQVFLDKNAERERYMGFLRKDSRHILLDKIGKPMSSDRLRNTENLMKHFDQHSKPDISSPLPNPHLSM